MQSPKFYTGRFINEADDAAERRVAVIGKKVASQLFPGIDDPVGKVIDDQRRRIFCGRSDR